MTGVVEGSTKKTVVNASAFAKAAGVTAATVSRHIKSGLIKAKRNRKTKGYDIVLEDELTSYSKVRGRKGVEASWDKQDKEKKEQNERTESDDSATWTYFDARLVKERYAAQKAKLDFELATKEMMRTEDVRAEIENIGVKLQKGVMAIPDRVAPLAAAENDARRVHHLLVVEFKRALSELAAELRRVNP